MFYLLAVEEWSSPSWAKPGEGEECGQPGVPEERPPAVHLPAIRQREAGSVARHPHHAAAQPRGEKQIVCHCTRYAMGKPCLHAFIKRKILFTAWPVQKVIMYDLKCRNLLVRNLHPRLMEKNSMGTLDISWFMWALIFLLLMWGMIVPYISLN